MNPIYFPFTYVSKPAFRAISACFKKIDVYQPSSQKVPDNMEKWYKNGVLDIHIPVKDEEDILDKLCKEYKDWGNLHNGPGLSFFKTQADTIPFFDETFPSQIKADIQKKHVIPVEEKPNPLLAARMFLRFAQDFDIQHFEMEEDIQAFEKMREDLLKNLKGESEDILLKSAFGNNMAEPFVLDSGDHMIKERIEAWIRLVQHDSERSGIFITTNRSAFDYLLEEESGSEMLLDLNSIPLYENISEETRIWQSRLIEYLDLVLKNTGPASNENFVETPDCKGCDTKVSLKLYLVPGRSPHEFFSRFVENKPHRTELTSERRVFKNTLIGLVGWTGRLF